MILKQFESDFNVIFKPPRPLKSCKMYGRGIKNQKKTLLALRLRKLSQKVAKKRSNWPLNQVKTRPKRYLNSTQKYDEKRIPKIQNLSSEMGEVFVVFGS